MIGLQRWMNLHAPKRVQLTKPLYLLLFSKRSKASAMAMLSELESHILPRGSSVAVWIAIAGRCERGA